MIIELSTGGIMTMDTHPHDNWIGAGWAVVPHELEALALDNSPFLRVELDECGEIMDIIPDFAARAAWEAAAPPERDPAEPFSDDSLLIDLAAMLVDQEYRLTLLELGLGVM